MEPLLEARGLGKHFPVRRGLLQLEVGRVRAVDGVDLTLRAGECFALVGESGSGKTTLGRLLVRLLDPTAGSLRFAGEDLLALSGRALRRRRRAFQMIFQDPYGSLNPRMRVGEALAEPLEVHRIVPPGEVSRRVAELLETVELPAAAAERYPHQFSGGQRQRIGIARALASEPDLVVADEPVSALDVSVQAQVLNLLARLQDGLSLTLLLISHDLALVEQIADRIGVMYLGRLVEIAPGRRLFDAPLHPYTVSLLSAVPVPDPERRREVLVLPGEVPSPLAPPPGCPFHPRCPIARDRCAVETPALTATADGASGEAPGHRVACHFPGELSLDGAVPPRPAEAGSRNATGPSRDGNFSRPGT